MIKLNIIFRIKYVFLEMESDIINFLLWLIIIIFKYREIVLVIFGKDIGKS